MQYAVASVPVAPILEGLRTLVEPQLRSRSLRYSVADIDPTIEVVADREKTEQILINLLSNATKFTAPGGAISLSVVRKGDTVEIRVADTGVGIPADRLASVFEPFVQLAPYGPSARQGTGLGLAISRDLARGMGGELWAESEPNVGSTFVLSLPSRTTES